MSINTVPVHGLGFTHAVLRDYPCTVASRKVEATVLGFFLGVSSERGGVDLLKNPTKWLGNP